jgi:hypothetical protein
MLRQPSGSRFFWLSDNSDWGKPYLPNALAVCVGNEQVIGTVYGDTEWLVQCWVGC